MNNSMSLFRKYDATLFWLARDFLHGYRKLQLCINAETLIGSKQYLLSSGSNFIIWKHELRNRVWAQKSLGSLLKAGRKRKNICYQLICAYLSGLKTVVYFYFTAELHYF